ncbi:MAG: squalene/phytoene synthase family protein [Candidatus Kapabacteria bacterium]|nr:squalene/phytoene synthase family protein [Ignavibacteriota bacterium]MCW5885216.1 squalene/phytoene synthase family protein [Candidatus Kapabacteria bacterium]
MDALTQEQLASYEKVDPPNVEKSNFLYSFSLLPKEERMAINTVYAFCSYIDDIVDSTPNINKKAILKKLDRLSWWENEIENIYSGSVKSPVMLPFVGLINRFEIPKQYFLTLIDGVRRDLLQFRYANFDELKDYCYSVASVVGLISIEIFGHKYEETKNYAINLGYALQLTNIMRDVKFDKDRGYIYLPLDELEKFNYSESDIIKEIYNENFVNLMNFQADRAREYYHRARMYLKPDEKTTIVAAEIMDSIYFRLLEKIELQEFDVYGPKKIRVSTAHKLIMTLKHWLSVNMFIRRIKKH